MKPLGVKIIPGATELTRTPAATEAVGGTDEATPPRADARPAPAGADMNRARPAASRRLALGAMGLDADSDASTSQKK